MVYLVDTVTFLAENFIAFLIVACFIDGYMLVVSTDENFTSSLFIFNFSSLSFRLDA